MIETYDILFRVTIQHTYFADGICDEISVIPDSATRKLMHNYGLIFRQIPGGFLVMTQSNRKDGGAFLSEKVETAIQLNFLLSFTNPYILNITDIADIDANAVRLYSNKQSGVNPEVKDSFSFSSGNLAQLVPDLLTISNNTLKKLELEKNGHHFNLELSGPDKSLSVGEFESGIYKMVSDGIEQYIYLKPDTISFSPFAVLSFDLNDINIIDNNQQLLHPAYTLQMKAIKTYWQYIILKKEKPENLVVELSEKGDMFEKSDLTMADNKQVVVFTSKEEIQISEKKDDYYRLKLRNGDPSNDLILISKLPLPDMTVLTQKMNEKLYTPIYVNY